MRYGGRRQLRIATSGGAASAIGLGGVGLCSRELLAARSAIPAPRSNAHRLRMETPSSLDIVRVVRDSRFACGYQCVHCRGSHIVRWGGFAGRQRYRCRTCRRTFSDLTQTAFAYTKKIGKWPAYLELIRRSTTLRYAAGQLDVHVSTTFRWRHALLSALRRGESDLLSGTVELREISFAHSRKGSRRVHEARQRGSRGRGWEWFEVARDRVLIARARTGAVHASIVGGNVVVSEAVQRALLPRLVGRCTFTGRMPRAGPCISPLRAAGHDYLLASSAIVERRYESRHTHNVDACARRLMVWLERFRGVASRYLENYLMWHRIVDPDQIPIWVSAVIISSLPVRATGHS